MIISGKARAPMRINVLWERYILCAIAFVTLEGEPPTLFEGPFRHAGEDRSKPGTSFGQPPPDLRPGDALPCRRTGRTYLELSTLVDCEALAPRPRRMPLPHPFQGASYSAFPLQACGYTLVRRSPNYWQFGEYQGFSCAEVWFSTPAGWFRLAYHRSARRIPWTRNCAVEIVGHATVLKARAVDVRTWGCPGRGSRLS